MRTSFGVLLSLFSLLTLLLLTPACGGGPAPEDPGSVVVGVTSELRAGVDIQELHVVMRVNGAIIHDETRGTWSGADVPLSFPAELSFDQVSEGDRVEVELEAFGGGKLRLLLVTRRAATEVVGGRKLLLRVRLESECTPSAGDDAAACDAPTTCITGSCRDSFVSPSKLEVYSPSWSQESTDICKPAGAGEPVVVVGKGQSDYLPMDDGEVAQVEAGPQGGHHIWVAVRMKNLHQSGSITTVSGHVEELDLDLSPLNVIFTFDQDEGGYCKLYGLRYQLDTNGVDVHTLLGKQVRVRATITEGKGSSVGTGERLVTLSDTIL